MSVKDKLFGPFYGIKESEDNEPKDEKEIKQSGIQKFVQQIKFNLKQKKKSTIVLYILIFLFMLYIIGLFTSFIRVFANLNVQRDILKRDTGVSGTPKYSPAWTPWDAFLCVFDFRYSVFILIPAIIGLMYLRYWYIKNHIAMGDYTVEGRSGALYKKQLQDASLGSARRMNNREIQKNFLVLTPKELKEKNPNTLIFGRDPNTGNYIMEKKYKHSEMPNRNCFVVGDSGSYKSTNFIIPGLKQIARRGENFICTDTSGEILSAVYADLKKNNYEIYVLNTVETDHSDTMNFIGAVGNDLDLSKTITETLIEATHNPLDREDPYFLTGMKALLSAIIILVNTELKQYSSISGIIDFLIDNPTSEKIKEKFETYKKEQHEAYRQFCLFEMSPNKENFISNLNQRLGLFVSSGISRICSVNGLNLVEQFGSSEKKSALFLTTDKTYGFIGALILNLSTKLLVSHAKKCTGRTLPRRLFFVLDEFLTMGYVPNMGTYLAENRKFGFIYYLICQIIPDFYEKYSENVAKTIMGNCVYKLMYGAGDIDTAQLFESYGGLATIRTSQTAYKHQIIKDKDQAREGVQQRSLYYADELHTFEIEKLILFKTHQHPLELEKPFYKTLPCFAEEEQIEFDYTKYVPHVELEKSKEADKKSLSQESGKPEQPPQRSDKPEQPSQQPEEPDHPLQQSEVPDKSEQQHTLVKQQSEDEVPLLGDHQNGYNRPDNRHNSRNVNKGNRKPKNRNNSNEDQLYNMIDAQEEAPERRPCENESEVIEKDNQKHIMKNGELVPVYKVLFKIDLSAVEVRGSIPSNKYCSFGTRFVVSDLKSTMNLVHRDPGRQIVGLRRTRIEKIKSRSQKNVDDYYFDSTEKSEQVIRVPRSDIYIEPITRKITAQNIKL